MHSIYKYLHNTWTWSKINAQKYVTWRTISFGAHRWGIAISLLGGLPVSSFFSGSSPHWPYSLPPAPYKLTCLLAWLDLKYEAPGRLSPNKFQFQITLLSFASRPKKTEYNVILLCRYSYCHAQMKIVQNTDNVKTQSKDVKFVISPRW